MNHPWQSRAGIGQAQHTDADRCINTETQSKVFSALRDIARPFHKNVQKKAYISQSETGQLVCGKRDARFAKRNHTVACGKRDAHFSFFHKASAAPWMLPASVIRCMAPIICVVLLSTSVIYGENMEHYGFAVEYNGQLLGYIAEEEDYYTALSLVDQQLANTNDTYDIPSHHKLTAVAFDATVPYLTAPTLADEMLHAANITLMECYGVYRGEDFLGAVDEPDIIRHALAAHIADYTNSLAADAESVFYTVPLRYDQGLYAAQQKVDAEKLAAQLTESNESIETLITQKETSVYTLAQQYSMTVDALYALNPCIDERIPKATAVKVRVTESAMPIAYTATMATVTLIDYPVQEVPTANLPLGQREIISPGSYGEAAQTVSITYVNGKELNRKVLTSTQLSEPITEIVAVGTYVAKPKDSTTKLYGTGEYTWPVNGGYISDPFISNRNHKGMDIAAPANSEIFAAADGTVLTAGWHDGGYGYYVVIDHGSGHKTLYAHCNEILVNVGQAVTQGQLIALVGSTGRSTGNHLHFEVILNDVRQNPAEFLRVNADERRTS